MDREWLASHLAEGRSIESIARETGRSASTVGYWVKKHGLRSSHAERHAGKGAIPVDVLEALIRERLSIRGIAERLDVSYATVRHWLRKYGLRTLPTERAERILAARAEGERDLVLSCRIHGEVKHVWRPDNGGARCARCRVDLVEERRRRVKKHLVREHGGCCFMCGYDRSLAALHFHHLDPADKAFGIGHLGVSRSLERSRAEAEKCVLLCANCHAEVEGGVAELPFEPVAVGPERLRYRYGA